MATSRSAKKQPSVETAEKKAFSLADLKPAQGATRDRLRVGRGRASGAGKTCNRGHNGEGQRSGRSRKRGFEGGQMPLYRRLPHITGFELINQRRWLELNIKDLAGLPLSGETNITLAALEQIGLYKPTRHDGIRLLGNGDINAKFTVEAHYVTPSARSKIEAAGGTVTIV